MRQQFRRSGDGGAARLSLRLGGDHLIEPVPVAQVLFQEDVEVLVSELFEEGIQPPGQRRAGKTGRRRPAFERQLAERVIRFKPALGHLAHGLHQAGRGPVGQVTLAVALERLARFANHCRAQSRLGRQISQEVIRQVHVNSGIESSWAAS